MKYFLVNSFLHSLDGKGVFSNSDDYISNEYWKISKDLCIDDRQLKASEKLFTCVEVGDVLVLKEDTKTYFHAMRTVKALGQVTKIDNNAYKLEVNWFDRTSWRTELTNQFQLLPRPLIDPINSDNFFDLLFLNKILDHIIDHTNFG